ncbi:MAG: NAD(P)H-dependent oxidoreductase subunit E, partial [Planctomycetota bacterium]
MDIRVSAAEPSPTERDAIDAVLGLPASGWLGGARDMDAEAHTALVGAREARSRRDLLLPALQAVQARAGWIGEGALNYICKRLVVPPAEAYGVATFYHLLATTPRPPTVVHVCDDIACRTAGAEGLCADFERRVGAAGARTGAVTWKRSPCLGQCERAPAVMVTAAGETP